MRGTVRVRVLKVRRVCMQLITAGRVDFGDHGNRNQSCARTFFGGHKRKDGIVASSRRSYLLKLQIDGEVFPDPYGINEGWINGTVDINHLLMRFIT